VFGIYWKKSCAMEVMCLGSEGIDRASARTHVLDAPRPDLSSGITPSVRRLMLFTAAPRVLDTHNDSVTRARCNMVIFLSLSLL